ncbi:putative Amino acid transporter system N2 [Giardia muris]|uniref:Putative Amino acid transporter system N2 n=1 Tax=Giardia muris TaxID=5742 RepID=A0A4Z1SY24_GIAMU|nr:putative Amino acid transporter system N2 [Giardia muris]|eukprot:TNJ30410.1 putative Amino acid transporter system N2 [Giardia muris]
MSRGTVTAGDGPVFLGEPLSLETSLPDEGFELSLLSDVSEQFVVPFVGSASGFSSVINLANTILGPGLLALPYCLMRSGWAVGIFALLLMVVIGSFSFYLLSFVADTLQIYEYAAIATKLYNRHVGRLVGVLSLALTGGLISSFMVMIRENMFFFSYNPDYEWASRVLLIGLAFLVILPLTLTRNLSSLWITSFVSLGCMLYIGGVLTVFYLLSTTGKVTPIAKGPLRAAVPSIDAVMAVASLTMSYCGHYNSINIYRELKVRSLRKMTGIVVSTAIICTAINLISGVFGYLMFTDRCEADIIMNLGEYKPARVCSWIANVCVILILMLSYPVVCFSFRRSLENLIFHAEFVQRKWIILISIATVMASTVIGCMVTDVGFILDITGILSGLPLVFIFPSLYAYTLLSKRSRYNTTRSTAAVRERQEEAFSLLKIRPRHITALKNAALTSLIVGVVIFATATTCLFYTIGTQGIS